jgi:hypothetical protein
VTGSLPAHEVLPQGRTPALQGGEASQNVTLIDFLGPFAYIVYDQGTKRNQEAK